MRKLLMDKRFIITMLSILLIIFIVGISTVILGSNTKVADTELKITEENGVLKVENIKNYLNKSDSGKLMASSNLSSNSKIKNVLKALKYDDSEIANMSPEDIRESIDAEYAQVASVNYNAEELIDNGTKQYNKITITTRLYRTPQYDTNIRAYRVEVTAYWDKSPTYRLKDILAIAATNNSVYGKSNDGTRKLQMTYTESFTLGGMKSYTFDAPHKKVEELSDAPPLLGVRANLPNDVPGLGAATMYHNIRVTINTLLYNNNAFSIYSAYGHKTVGGKATVSLKGWDITFNAVVDSFKGILISETSKA